MLLACSKDEPTPEAQPETSRQQEVVSLDACPQDDRLWADAYLAASTEEDRDSLDKRMLILADRCPDMWHPYWIRGLLHYATGDREQAEDLLQDALRKLGDGDDNWVAHAVIGHELGWLSRDGGDLEHGEKYLRSALDAARRTGRYDLIAQCASGLAGVVIDTGMFQLSLDLHDEAVDAYEQIGQDQYARWVRSNKGVLLMELGDLNTARTSLEEVFEESEKSGDEFIMIRVVSNLGNLEFLAGNSEKAEGWYSRIPESASEQQGFAEFNRGRMSLQSGNRQEARSHFQRASEQKEHPVLALLARSYQAYVEDGDFRSVIAEADAGGVDEAAWVARWLLGKSHIDHERPELALPPLEEAVAILDEQGRDVNPMDAGLRFLRERSEPYVELSIALAKQPTGGNGLPGRILNTMEKTHARALRRALQGQQATPEAASLGALQSGLKQGELVLDYLIGEDRGVLLAIGPDDVGVHRIPGTRDLQEPLKRYRNALRRPLFNADARNDPEGDLERSLKHGIEIRKALLDPVRGMLDETERIYIVPDTEIALLPFVALPWDRTFLGERFEVAVLPMAGGAPEWDRSRTPMLLAGDPLPDEEGEYPALPTSGMELDLVSRSWKSGEQSRLDQADLTAKQVQDQLLGSFKTLHFATHAVASTADPNGCAVYLSRGDRLGLKQILDLDLHSSPLVVLSACQTGEGELIPGEGVVGLGWAFLRAGAQGVVASLWSVEDTASAELMIAFHRHMSQGQDPVTALSLAQREMAAARFHPAYWAPFIIVLRPETGS